MGFRYLPVRLTSRCTAYCLCETAERIQMKSLGCWLQEAISIPGRVSGNIFPSRVTNIDGTLCVCLGLFLYNGLYFAWWNEGEGHYWQCLLCITCTASARLFLVCSSCKWSVLTWYCMDRASSCNIYVIQQDTQCFMIEFIHNNWWLDMFRTSVFHPQKCLQAVCCKFGMLYFAYYSIRPDVVRL